MSNKWIAHVKQYAADNNMSYKDALSKAKATYKKEEPKSKELKGGKLEPAPAPAPAEVLKGGKMKVKKVKVKCDNKSCPEGLCAVAVEKKSKKKN